MKLERRFDWHDTESVYKAVDEEDCEKAQEGRIRFRAVRVDGRVFVGVGYSSSIADMVDTKTGFWKLEKGKGKYNVVVSVPGVPLAESGKRSGKASKGE